MSCKEIISAAELAEFQIVSRSSRIGQYLADALYSELGIRLQVTKEILPEKRAIQIGIRPFCDYNGCRYGFRVERRSIYLDGGNEELLRQAADLMLRSIAEEGCVKGNRYGYCWPEKAIHYGLRLNEQKQTAICEGVEFLRRSYVRSDGEPVEAFFVIAEPESPTKAAVWGCPQGESMIVPEQVKWMRSLGADVVAAVNADFFHFFNNGDKTTFGAQIIDGTVYKEPSLVEHYGDNWFGMTESGEYVMSDYNGYFSTYKGHLQCAVGGGVWLMREQMPVFHSSPAVEPRTAIAITRDGGLVMLCVDGRSEQSVGATYTDLLQIFLELDIELRSILNLDGGHSTILMGKQADGSMAILNNPSSGLDALRPVADILTLVK